MYAYCSADQSTFAYSLLFVQEIKENFKIEHDPSPRPQYLDGLDSRMRSCEIIGFDGFRCGHVIVLRFIYIPFVPPVSTSVHSDHANATP